MIPPQPPAPPAPPEPPKMVPDEEPLAALRRGGDNPFAELGLTQEQFAEIALSGPLDWDEEQLDVLQSLLMGDPIEPEVALEIVEDFLRHTPKLPKVPPQRKRDLGIPRELMDPEELAEELASISSLEPVMYQPLSAPDVPTSNVNLDDWLKKKG